MMNLENILTSEDKVSIKQSMIKIILDQFKIELESSDTYLLNPRNISDFIEEGFQEAFSESFKEINKEVKDTIKKKMKESIKTMDLQNILKDEG